jgi:hypothetical protein
MQHRYEKTNHQLFLPKAKALAPEEMRIGKKLPPPGNFSGGSKANR